ncbi:uncharacterized protein LOC106658650 [Trichogramma pretiosum]|uniref:uncharacterized protein LOC106658650 n=1 Tax=Trichogramma pretiosum TaxID=7493 RepID=UPI0006C9BA02|nr:uncharacterized protein LOC106658650 [Trichogramma pretiosum]
MESIRDTVRIKKEPNHTWPDAGDGYNFDSVGCNETKNFDTIPFYKLPANHMNEAMPLQDQLNEKILIDLECKDVKPKQKSLLATTCKTEHQNYYLPIVKTENKIQTNYLIDKELIILIKEHFNYENNCQFSLNLQSKRDKSKEVEKCDKITRTKSSHKINLCQKTCKTEVSLKKRINTPGKGIRLYEREI